MGGRYRSLSGALIDPEKHHHSKDYESDEVPYLVSSRDTSNSYAPMLGQHSNAKPASHAYHLPRRRFSRYFTLIISSFLLCFIWYLVRSSWASRAEIQLGLRKPPPSAPAWEQFPFLQRYHGGIRSLVSRRDNVPEYPADPDVEVQRLNEEAMRQKQTQDAQIAREKGFQRRKRDIPGSASRFDPYPSYSEDGERKDFAPAVKCYLDNTTKIEIPQLLAFNGVTKGFPDPVLGSHEVLGLRNDMCFERYGRLGPYGFGYSKKYGGSGAGLDGENKGADQVWGDQLEINYGSTKWAEVQDRCIEANAGRFKPASPIKKNHFYLPTQPKVEAGKHVGWDEKTSTGKQYLNRTAVVIRTWFDYQYDDEDLFYLRALVNELSLQSGAEYSVYFLIHVKDDNRQIWADEETYQRTLDEALPEEFRGMGILWSERQMGLIYGGVAESMYRNLPVHGVYRSTYMPLQHFAHMHPEFEFVWHWEMDIRYTGHYYHLFKQVSGWAKKQPRKGLWERNGRFYVPSQHGTWEDFRQLVRVQTQHGTASKENVYAKLAADAGTRNPMDTQSRMPETPIWGPLRPFGEGDETDNPDNDPQPSTTYDKDNYEWGVGEEADFITFNPLFDPSGTNWILAEDVTGYNTTKGYPPRRTAIITASRLSRRLLETMHRETALKRHTMFSEMWPGSCALHHGYKAVYAPHPVYIDRAWPTSYLAAIFNNGRNGAAGGARTSVFSDERQHNFRGTTWYYDAGFAPNLWKRWLGYKVDNDGGQEEEIAGEGRMCLPAMLLHPVKQVDMVYEQMAEVGT